MGRRPWEQAWQQALYGPAGFYRRAEGPAGHFATSAQGIPGVGEVLARAVAALAAREGLTRVVEVGAGRGELLGLLARTAPRLELVGCDVVDRPPALPGAVGWVRSPGGAALPPLPPGPALVLAHEWLDVVPAPVVQVDGAGVLRTVLVDDDGGEHLGDPAPAADVAWCARHWPALLSGRPGLRGEVGRPRDEAWARLGEGTAGLAVAVDYGHTRAARPDGGTLTGYRAGVQVPPLPDGSTDVTAHVAVDSLAADRLVRQRDLLRELGIGNDPPPLALAASDPPAYLVALAARSAVAAASAPGGLGDFWWVLRRLGRGRPGA